MGAKLLKYYDQAGHLGGDEARMRLVMLSLMPSDKARKLPDSEENLQRFEMALRQLKTELARKKGGRG